ncbi:hypothetical protein ACFWQ6_31790 [Streptomyces coelicoflavus]|uniref:hypothetical protein n=1 Tax=Streptomyces TaxID=1883 RepID=UPI0013DCC843|nr:MULTISPECIES: hypothetical protein [Streptomyces]KAF2780828.1 hypothetical protein STPH1_5498 [Streptomyces sp. OM5714]MCX5038535.1 hypothetical protein [Streptomyces coelicoflavus]MDI6519689.1 hypothetical protein [Streptomyces coelicoflavus]NHI10340.1 hypothetical protein [Streptomyces sp. KO7888]
MADTEQVDTEQAGAKRGWADRWDAFEVTRTAGRIEAFAKAHGGAEAQVAYLGERGARIVLVGADGAWGDLVARTPERARKAVEQSGITVHDDFDGEYAAKVATGRYEWSRMAGIQVGGPSNT